MLKNKCRYSVTCNASQKHLVLGKLTSLTQDQTSAILSLNSNAVLENVLVYDQLLLSVILYTTSTKDSIICFNDSIYSEVKFISFCTTPMPGTSFSHAESTHKCYHVAIVRKFQTENSELRYIHTILMEE